MHLFSRRHTKTPGRAPATWAIDVRTAIMPAREIVHDRLVEGGLSAGSFLQTARNISVRTPPGIAQRRSQ